MPTKPQIVVGSDNRTPTFAQQLPSGNWAQPTMSEDGAHATIGSKADTAVTNPALNASEIALLKGILKQLQGGGTGSAPADVIDRANRVLGKVAADDGAIAALGALAAAAITDPAQNASVIALLKGILKQLQGGGTGAAPVTLTGSTLSEAQALATRSAHIAQMLTVPVIMDFRHPVPKTSGQVFDNPHTFKYKTGNHSSLTDSPTSGIWGEQAQANYNQVATQDGTSSSSTRSGAGDYAQYLFSFSLLDDLKNRCIIPKWWTAAELRAAIKMFTVTWVGYGVGSNGGVSTYGATVKGYKSDYAVLNVFGTNTASSPGTITYTEKINPAYYIDSNGCLHILAHATHPSDGVVASTIYTDYVKVEVQLAAEMLITPIVEAMGRPGNVAPGRAVQVGGRDASGNFAVPRVVAPADAMPATHEGVVAAAMLMGFNGFAWDRLRVVGSYKYTAAINLAVGANAQLWVPAAGKKWRLMGGIIATTAGCGVALRDGPGGAWILLVRTTANQLTVPFLLGQGRLSSAANTPLEVHNLDGQTATIQVTLFGTEE